MATQSAADELDEAGRTLEAFASGPARLAAEQIERSFSRAGAAIRTEMNQIVRSGEADLDRLARKLARVLTEMALTQAFGPEPRGATTNIVMKVAGGDAAGGVAPSAAQIGAAAARAVRRGMRFA